MEDALTVDRLREVLHYDPDSGQFTWRHGGARCTKLGGIAGGQNTAGYWRIMIDLRRYFSHRLAFFYVTGRWPLDQIDHINGDKSDNRWNNLREATRTQNGQNRKCNRNSESGFKGVIRDSRGKRPWCAKIKHNGQTILLGNFDSPEDANAAYAAKAIELFGEFARTK